MDPENPETPENDTGILVAYLGQTIEESRRLRENLTYGGPDTRAPEPQDAAALKEDVTSPDPLSPPG